MRASLYKVTAHHAGTPDRHEEVIIAAISITDALSESNVVRDMPEFGVYFDEHGRECHSTDAIKAIYNDNWCNAVSYEVEKLLREYDEVDVRTAYANTMEPLTQMYPHKLQFPQIIGRMRR